MSERWRRFVPQSQNIWHSKHNERKVACAECQLRYRPIKIAAAHTWRGPPLLSKVVPATQACHNGEAGLSLAIKIVTGLCLPCLMQRFKQVLNHLSQFKRLCTSRLTETSQHSRQYPCLQFVLISHGRIREISWLVLPTRACTAANFSWPGHWKGEPLPASPTVRLNITCPADMLMSGLRSTEVYSLCSFRCRPPTLLEGPLTSANHNVTKASSRTRKIHLCNTVLSLQAHAFACLLLVALLWAQPVKHWA